MMSTQQKTDGMCEMCGRLTDATRYAYSSLCAVLLHQLYGNVSYNKKFQQLTITQLITHLHQSKQISNAVMAMLEGSGITDVSPLVAVLHEDPFLQENGLHVLVNDRMALALKEGCYDSRMRVFLLALCRCLDVSLEQAEHMESTLLHTFQEQEHEMTEEEQEEQNRKDRKSKIKRYALIGAATVTGGTLLGLTGGLAAPFLAASIGTVVGGTSAAVLGSTAGIAIIGSLFGAAGAGLGGYKMTRRMGGIEEFEFDLLSEGRQLNLTIAITGWLLEDTDFRHIWLGLANSHEQYVLKYESKYLRQMGAAFEYILHIAMQATAQELLKLTVFSGVLAAIAWPMTLVSAAFVIDNPWSVCTQRTEAVGKHLASVLLARQQGKRPVTLIGFSLGARVIFYCLREMSQRSNCEGIVEDAILLGAPVPGHSSEWQRLAKVVAGRIVNGYCSTDWILRFVYRTTSMNFTIAGLHPVEWKDRRMENIDLSDVVEGHLDYMNKIDVILQKVGIRTREYAPKSKAGSLSEFVRIQKGKQSPVKTDSSTIGDENAAPSEGRLQKPDTEQDDSSKENDTTGSAGGIDKTHIESESVTTDANELEHSTETLLTDASKGDT